MDRPGNSGLRGETARDRAVLAQQFLLCRDAALIPEPWRDDALGDWHLGHDPSLPVTRLVDSSRRPLGWLLGWAVGTAGLVDEDATTVPAEDPEGREEWIYGHGGRFVAVLVAGPSPRVYLDPSGSLSVVYCPALECVGSTPSAIPRDGDTGDRTDLARLVGVPKNAMYPLDLTPRRNVFRLLPNHFLDLG